LLLLRIISQILKIYVILKYRSFLLFIGCILLENIGQFILFKLYFHKNYSFVKHTKKKDKSIVKNLKNLFFHKLGTLVVFNTDLILISKFISLKMVGIYSSYQILIGTLNMLSDILTRVISPIIGKYVAINSDKDNFNLWKRINIIYIFIGVIVSYSFYNLATDFVIIWIGKENTLGKVTVLLMSINLYIIFLRKITEIFKNAYGFFDDVQLPILESILNFFVSLFLVMKIGLNGVIIGTIISNIVVVSILKPLLVFKRCFKVSSIDYIKTYVNYIFLSILSIVLAEIFKNKIFNGNITSVYKWMLESTKLFILISIISFVVFLSDKNFRREIKLILKNL